MDTDGNKQFRPYGEKPRPRSPNNRPPDWKLIAHICLRAEEYFYECPICTIEILGKKRNLRAHLRDEHTQAQLVSYLVSWDDYFDDEDTEAEIDVEFITGTHIRVFLPGTEITKKLKQTKMELSHQNFVDMRNAITKNVAKHLSKLLLDKNYNPIGDEE